MISTIKPIMTRFLRAGLIVCLVMGCSCARRDQAPAPDLAGQDQANAELRFMKGDFDNALLEFEKIYATAPGAEDRNRALYGLACTRMMVARTGEQLAQAIANLQKWDEEKGSSPFSENRRLLVSALKHQGEYLKKKNSEQVQLERKKNSLIANQRQKITQMTETLERLQKQLEELEAIDENFQEKRKTL